MAVHHFHLTAEWSGGRNSEGYIETGNLKSKVSIPPEMDGPGIGTNPDEMLLGAAATCYMITLAAMIERTETPVSKLSLESEGLVDVTNGVITYKKIIHKPTVILQKNEAESRTVIERLVQKAEKSCMISRAIQGNIELELQANIKCDTY